MMTGKRIILGDRLLNIKLEDGLGWEQICLFLGVREPKKAFLSPNSAGKFLETNKTYLEPMYRRAWLRLLALMGGLVLYCYFGFGQTLI